MCVTLQQAYFYLQVSFVLFKSTVGTIFFSTKIQVCAPHIMLFKLMRPSGSCLAKQTAQCQCEVPAAHYFPRKLSESGALFLIFNVFIMFSIAALN